ncbi:Peptidoglycan/xylan/chitin deacetylase, PgdA/CDA1 family [Pelagirhabdus alkalitolerans]|uniref:Peptidoglycan/xylan/chitin deacetylase, PgdA/CDA1 family n=1 Tax=Pelagirhabdus alkalitolerans TaxID=1612202 RepID=A0A1G6M2R2_9BACI|nr:polysaccharide deacetylase family protein [Pelagirhabdus alkalitolerans]SDC49256.1 Peptidoglycan/xylan/chitin deacetylase, PgdA/CDA1 family [Pelagirhabdus alkalitolerans]
MDQGIYFIKLTTIKRVGLFILLCSFIFLINQQPPNQSADVFSTNGQPLALSKSDFNTSDVSLTFNMIWGDEVIEDILDRLETEDVVASFFVLGEWAEHHPHLMEMIDNQGHEVALLGYRYKNYSNPNPDLIQKDLYKGQTILGKLGFNQLTLFRPPVDQLDDQVLDTATKLGFDVVRWSVQGFDLTANHPDTISKHVMKEVSGGDIVMLHASDDAIHTPEALTDILSHLKEEKLKPVTLSQLISQAEVETELIE